MFPNFSKYIATAMLAVFAIGALVMGQGSQTTDAHAIASTPTPCVMRGDINLNCRYDDYDWQTILWYAANKPNLPTGVSQQTMLFADVNYDTVIDSGDAGIVQRWANLTIYPTATPQVGK